MGFKNFTLKQWCILLVYSVVNMLNASCVSIQGSFYPMVAHIKGASASQYGIVFGIYYLTIFIVSPFFGKLIPIYGAIFICNTGIFVTGVTSILFGPLDMVNGAQVFIGLSIAIRVVEGIGSTAFRVASLCIISNEFSDNIESAFAIFQSSFNVGLIVGPSIGGLLFEAGGFILPFTVEGVLHLCAIVAIMCIPSNYYEKDFVTVKCEAKYLDILSLPLVIMGMMTVFGAYMSAGLIVVFTEPQVRSLDLSPSVIGILLVLHGLSVSFSSPLWAKICESYLKPHYVWSFGSVLNLFSSLLFGPAPYFFPKMNIYICIASIIIGGTGGGAQTIAAFSGINKEVASAGFAMNKATHSLISTLYSSSLALGVFVGPTMGGLIVDTIGLPWGCHVYAVYHLILILATTLLVQLKSKDKYEVKERQIIKDASSIVTYNTCNDNFNHNSSSKGKMPLSGGSLHKSNSDHKNSVF